MFKKQNEQTVKEREKLKLSLTFINDKK